MKAVINDPKTGKSFQVELEKGKEAQLLGKKIGDVMPGGMFGAPGYAFKVTGGSNTAGFPMRRDVAGARKVKLLLSSGPGFRSRSKGDRAKKTVCGNMITENIVQVNVSVAEAGGTPLEKIFGKAEEEEKK